MATLELPKSSRTVVIVALVALGATLYRVCALDGGTLWLVAPCFLVSGFLGDLLTGLAHFGFDYVFPAKMPILGPIAAEFRQHHDRPTLDPSDYIVNLSKGSYASLPLSVIVWMASARPGSDWISLAIVYTLLAMSFWAFFFHQIHSYAHMGACLSPEEFKRNVARISRLPDLDTQRREFAKLFDAAPIPPVIRFLQRCRILLNPETHNLHHISFESDFSSVNGWSDPLMNRLFGPLARRMKAKQRSPEA
jgi:hypothetical protein